MVGPRGLDLIDQWLIGEPRGVEVLQSKLSSGTLTPYQRHVVEGYLGGFALWAIPLAPAAQPAMTADQGIESVIERNLRTRSTRTSLLAEQRRLLDETWDHLSMLRAIRARQLADRDAAVRILERAEMAAAHASRRPA